MCARPPTSDEVSGWNSMTPSSAMIAATQGCIGDRGACVVDSTWYQANAPRLIANALKRIGRRKAWLPGR